jgi:hypothetical protein
MSTEDRAQEFRVIDKTFEGIVANIYPNLITQAPKSG